MSLAIIADTFEDAVAEASALDKMGELDDAMLKDIAQSYEVDFKALQDYFNKED